MRSFRSRIGSRKISNEYAARLRILVALAGSIAVAGTWGCAAEATEAPPLAIKSANVDSTRCWPAIKQLKTNRSAQCMYVRVPLWHPDSGGALAARANPPLDTELQLAVAVLQAPTPSSRPPLFYLRGGPFETMAVLKWVGSALDEIADDRDLVVFDYRGVGKSKPRLECSISDADKDALVPRHTSSPEHENSRLLEHHRILSQTKCAPQLAKKGLDLSAFNYRQLALDVDAIRGALGYPQIDIYSESAGTTIAQHLDRLRPGMVRYAVLDSPLAYDVDFAANAHRIAINHALREVSRACLAEPGCRAGYCINQTGDRCDDVENMFATLYQQLNDTPVAISLHEAYRSQLESPPKEFLLWGHSLVQWAVGRLAHEVAPRPLIDDLVTLIGMTTDRILSRPSTPKANALLQYIAFRLLNTAELDPRRTFAHRVLLYTTSLCTSYAIREGFLPPPGMGPLPRPPEFRPPPNPSLVQFFVPPPLNACLAGMLERDSFIAPPNNRTMQVLILASRFDAITPPMYARRAQQLIGADRTQLTMFQSAPHAAAISRTPDGQCARHLARKFFLDPNSTRPPNCADRSAPPPMTRPPMTRPPTTRPPMTRPLGTQPQAAQPPPSFVPTPPPITS